MSNLLTGIAASPGFAIAKAYRLKASTYVPVRSEVTDTKQEAQRFREAVEQAKQELESIRELTEARLGSQKAEIFESHLLSLEDPDFIDVILDNIVQEAINAEYALHEVSQAFIEALLAMDNELLRERAADVRDVSGRLMSGLRGEKYTTVSDIAEESIIIAEDLSPSDTAQLNLDVVRGFITEIGSRTSHSAIMARSLGIPAIVGVGASAGEITAGVTVIMDAVEGRMVVDPSEEELEAYRQKKEQYEIRQAELSKLKDQPTISKDGRQVELAANIGSVEDMQKVLDNGAEGIGLFRTEFLYMGRSSFPTEEEQFKVYKYVLEKMEGKPVVIRTLDIGGDKELPYLELPKESNPFLGLRAVRLCLDRQDLFRTQLRALLRASRHGQLKIMFPMIAVLEELLEAKRLLQEERDKLVQEGQAVADHIEVGMMIEVPAAALAADSFAQEVDFFSIGTNDLIQYTMAADRMNETVSYLYQPCHPSILRLIQMVIRAAEREGKWVGMCGEMAGDETAIPLLLGLGLHEFSMSASSILPARALIRELVQEEWVAHADRALAMRSQNEIKEYVHMLTRSDSK
ncbi:MULTISPECIES: phosphoenolpyruvate--protein phosphotransferase [unclassified Paenibacillus]|uniref:phosphoenolpyruvate--protein phosphotransferase n=1 Tax=unclassified Paenibacillus TaxID=185978 RepID=UPI001AE54DA0|nr:MULTISPECIES: phosphoenolpyruvate--protein phosphotransferase [unclassified Paenibacillus]MBP1157413.1 phosphotransferase system enzyme I (PtsI) [Paenibacillus sp. PvP091]MBP1171849.1 phosphotransferase system enzyme I (PtsI) [Paenibacillus sp. PvR098]MBP2438230.1 phosphotransferase system enzyme I (PtsI) [Paenibacillus sp. PvP052]